MKTYLISYDLAEGGDYEALYEDIKAYGTWAHITESLWAVKTENSAKEVRDDLAKHFPEGSRYFVIKSGFEAAWNNVMCSSDWLKKNL
ncbi:CRISPR-associated protein Cas2 [uncultured Draconibacterium sp.]|uniref:CRISPR-associated protein Cas2 n=1 Tax=uncultured Draconibacterium sp. TaxID=1573823 RepID=UPI002AA8CED5|nr:CRISPR-associated protein Cas2 [uncultured Draconibacterium sp.]